MMVELQPGTGSPCIDDATIAAFVEGTIDPASRSRVVAHLAICQDCYELVAEVIGADEELRQHSAGEASPRIVDILDRTQEKRFWTRRRVFGAVGGFGALAASLLIVVTNRGSEIDRLVEIVGSERPSLARPTGEFRYGAVRSPLRGPTSTENVALLAEVARLRERAARTNAAADLHAAGLAQLLAGDSTSSIQTLQSATRTEPNDAALVADLGAAHMTRFLDRGDPADAASALEAFDKALSLELRTKEAWFNKALLLERLNRPTEALAAWEKYLELPDDDSWRQEAIRTRDALQRQPRAR